MKTKNLEFSKKRYPLNPLVCRDRIQKQLVYAIKLLLPTNFTWMLGLILFTTVLPISALTQNEAAKLLAFDGEEEDRFGTSVSISGDRAVIGAHWDNDNGSNSGSAYVFERDDSGHWIQTAKLLPFDNDLNALDENFGASVSIDGGRAMIGAPFDDNNNGVKTGSVYVFERDGLGNWIQTAKFSPPDNEVRAYFGISVSIDGDRAVIGASFGEGNENNSGTAYVFERDVFSGFWIQVAKLFNPDGAEYGFFGQSVSIDGDRVVVGARSEQHENGISNGSVYVFERDGLGNWYQTDKLLVSASGGLDQFGFSVSIDGDYIVAGVPEGFNETADTNTGLAYIFERDVLGSWNQAAKLFAIDSAYPFNFGHSVTVDGDRVVVGAYADENENGILAGSAYVYQRDILGNWSRTVKLLAPDGAVENFFGFSVSIDGSQAVVGALFAKANSVRAGAAYIFNLQDDQQISIWDKTTTPENPSTTDPNAVELGVKFKAEVDGIITSILFYKGIGNDGEHIGNLWSNSGELLATATFSEETESGWQQVNFDNPARITAGEIYIASYFAPFGHYAVDKKYFSDKGIANGSLQLLHGQDGVSGGNGVYSYGPSAFPSETYNDNNYWIDLIFTADNIANPYSCPCSLWDDTIIPEQLAENDTNAVELGIKFTSDVEGYISAIRFYKSDLNTGTHVGSLWNSNGELLAQATFNNETESGWQQVNFDNPVKVEANMQYVASYHTNTGYYSVDTLYFSSSSYLNGPLTSQRNGVNKGDGVYLYGSGGFPTETWLDSNYWVDVVFITDLLP